MAEGQEVVGWTGFDARIILERRHETQQVEEKYPVKKQASHAPRESKW